MPGVLWVALVKPGRLQVAAGLSARVRVEHAQGLALILSTGMQACG